MYAKENEKTSQVIRWIRRNTTNMLIWDVLCGDSWFDYTVGDCIDMLERVAAAEMYQFALILITKLGKCRDMDEAITNIIIKRISEPDSNGGIITDCIKEFKNKKKKKGIMGKNIEE